MEILQHWLVNWHLNRFHGSYSVARETWILPQNMNSHGRSFEGITNPLSVSYSCDDYTEIIHNESILVCSEKNYHLDLIHCPWVINILHSINVYIPWWGLQCLVKFHILRIYYITLAHLYTDMPLGFSLLS